MLYDQQRRFYHDREMSLPKPHIQELIRWGIKYLVMGMGQSSMTSVLHWVLCYQFPFLCSSDIVPKRMQIISKLYMLKHDCIRALEKIKFPFNAYITHSIDKFVLKTANL